MVLSPNDFKLVASVSKQDEGLEGVSHSCSAGQFYPPAGQYNPPPGTNTPHMAPLMDEGIHSVKTLFQFLWSSSLLKIADSKIWPLHDVCVNWIVEFASRKSFVLSEYWAHQDAL